MRPEAYDFRDGTNLTGLNPGNKKLIRHIGFSSHSDPSANMYMIQHDRTNLLDTMLVSINANDKLFFNMQYNVIPLATAKNMGVIVMNVFADGAMYDKPAVWSSGSDHVIRTAGSLSLPSSSLIRYTLTTPGVHVAIIGIGQISDKQEECQLCNNLITAQVLLDGLTEAERTSIEETAKMVKGGNTNYFQLPAISLTAPTDISVTQKYEYTVRIAVVNWNTAYAGDAPLKTYEIWCDGTKITEIPYTPQITLEPFRYSDHLNDTIAHTYYVQIVDTKDRTAKSAFVTLEAGEITDITDTVENRPLKIIVTNTEMKIMLNEEFISWNASFYNLQGRLISSELIESDILTFNASSLSSGIYIVVLSHRNYRRVIKINKP